MTPQEPGDPYQRDYQQAYRAGKRHFGADSEDPALIQKLRAAQRSYTQKWRDEHGNLERLRKSIDKLTDHFLKELKSMGRAEAFTHFKSKRRELIRSLRRAFGDSDVSIAIGYMTLNSCHVYAVYCLDEEETLTTDTNAETFRLCAVIFTTNVLPLSYYFMIEDYPELCDFIKEWSQDIDPLFEGDCILFFLPPSFYPEEIVPVLYRKRSQYRTFSLEERLLFLVEQHSNEENNNAGELRFTRHDRT